MTSSVFLLISENTRYIARNNNYIFYTSRTSFKYRIKHIDNTVFVIDNRDKVIDFMDTSNATGETRKCISTWYFSTLYTKIPDHDKLISKMTTFVKKLFDTNPEKSYICFSDKGRSAYWSKYISKTNTSFSCDQKTLFLPIALGYQSIFYQNRWHCMINSAAYLLMPPGQTLHLCRRGCR